jgi:peptidoglycan/LPS O-acetylase OafA/YrhL
MSQESRIIGIDLFRGIAAFAVVILHSDEVIEHLPEGWSFILNFSAFAVPFFLATSFYLMVGRLYNSPSQPIQWTKRLSRLLIPYAFWSIFYLGIKISRHLLKHQIGKVQTLLENWPGLIFLGQSEFHLYFIPLLISGILVVILTESLIRKQIKLSLSLFLLFFSLIIYQLYSSFLDASSSSFIFSSTIINQSSDIQKNAYSALIYILKIMGFLFRCLPYVVAALVLNNSTIKNRLLNLRVTDILISLAAFAILNALPSALIPKVLGELLRGYSTLILALGASNYIRGNSIVSSLGSCSFGIYLMHLLILQILWSFFQKIGMNFEKISFLLLMMTVILTFAISWLATFTLMKQKKVSSLIFGA